METTAQQANQAIDIMKAAFVRIAAAKEQGLPSGHLYATFMGAMDSSAYEKMINLMVRMELITKKNQLLFINNN